MFKKRKKKNLNCFFFPSLPLFISSEIKENKQTKHRLCKQATYNINAPRARADL